MGSDLPLLPSSSMVDDRGDAEVLRDALGGRVQRRQGLLLSARAQFFPHAGVRALGELRRSLHWTKSHHCKRYPRRRFSPCRGTTLAFSGSSYYDCSASFLWLRRLRNEEAEAAEWRMRSMVHARVWSMPETLLDAPFAEPPAGL